jgi:proton-coupled amino acid transporter
LTAIALISLYTFLLLVETRNKIPVSFGDIGGVLFGKSMRFAVLLAITLSQVKKKKEMNV